MKLRLCAMALLALAAPQIATAQQNVVPVIDGPTYLMTYVEVVPSAAAQALSALKDYRDAALLYGTQWSATSAQLALWTQLAQNLPVADSDDSAWAE